MLFSRRSSRASMLVTASLAGAAALCLVAAPASANGFGQYVDFDGWDWYVAAGPEWEVASAVLNDVDGNPLSPSAWAGGSMAFWDPAGDFSDAASLQPAAFPFQVFTCGSAQLLTDGADKVVACDTTFLTSWGLSVTSDTRVLAPGDLARTTFFVTNTTSEPVTLGYTFSWDYNGTFQHVASSAPDVFQDSLGNLGSLGAQDVWSYNFSPDTLTAGVAWGIVGNDLLPTSPIHVGTDRGLVVLPISAGETIPAGATVALAFFQKVSDEVFSFASSPASGDLEPAIALMPAISPAEFMAEFASFSGRLTRGLPSDVTVGNWQTAAVPDPELAETGAGLDENLLLGGLAAALLGAGAALMIGSRLARAHRSRR